MMINENSIIRDYKIINKIGEGGMGSVYLAEDFMLERKVAIKVLNPILTQDASFTERFRSEAKAQASLIHPNIVALHNFFKEQDGYFMVMEYAEGITLKELIRRTGPVPEDRAVKIMMQLLEGFGYAHSKGVIHRDIKPGNIIVNGSDNVKIMDFGIAKILGDKGMTKTGTKMGTIYYMSPEQIRAARDIDQRTDIYSLGITFYEMLTGRLPFDTETESEFEVMEEIVRGLVPDLRQIVPSLRNEIVYTIYGMVEKDKNKRPNTCYLCGEKLKGVKILLHGMSKPEPTLDAVVSNNSLLHKDVEENGIKLDKKIKDISLLKVLDSGEGRLKTLFDDIYSLTTSPDTKFIATSHQNKLIKIWDVQSGTIMEKIAPSEYRSYSIKYSPDGKYLAIGSQDGKIKLWDITSGKLTKCFSYHKIPIWSISFSSNGEFVASGDDNGKISIWDINNEKLVMTFSENSGPIYLIKFSPLGKYLVSGGQFGKIILWNLNSGKAEKNFTGCLNSVGSLDISSDEKYLAAGGPGQFTKVWDIETGSQWNENNEYGFFIHPLLFYPVGNYLIGGISDGQIIFGEIRTGRIIVKVNDYILHNKTLDISSDGRFLVNAVSPNLINVWNIISE